MALSHGTIYQLRSREDRPAKPALLLWSLFHLALLDAFLSILLPVTCWGDARIQDLLNCLNCVVFFSVILSIVSKPLCCTCFSPPAVDDLTVWSTALCFPLFHPVISEPLRCCAGSGTSCMDLIDIFSCCFCSTCINMYSKSTGSDRWCLTSYCSSVCGSPGTKTIYLFLFCLFTYSTFVCIYFILFFKQPHVFFI